MFNRWGLWRGHTWAYDLFRQHHTEINQLYWSLNPVFRHAYREHRANPTRAPLALLGLRPVGRHNVDDPVRWRDGLKDAENWIRLSAVIAVTGYLEIFIKKATTLALESDPGVEHGRSRAVDGFAFRKDNADYDRTKSTSGCWIGDWQARASTYKSLFGRVPAELSNNVAELDKMRRVRNGVGHTFGRDVDAYDSHSLSSTPAMARVSEQRLQRWLGLVERVARDVDAHLGPAHVGEYEALCFFHELRSKRRSAPHDGWPRTARRQMGAAFGASPGREYARGLVKFYNRV